MPTLSAPNVPAIRLEAACKRAPMASSPNALRPRSATSFCCRTRPARTAAVRFSAVTSLKVMTVPSIRLSCVR
ncbi:hypothetical protein D3C71_1985520 [compost metagenome]